MGLQRSPGLLQGHAGLHKQGAREGSKAPRCYGRFQWGSRDMGAPLIFKGHCRMLLEHSRATLGCSRGGPGLPYICSGKIKGMPVGCSWEAPGILQSSSNTL